MLQYLQDQSLRTIGSGYVLAKVLLPIVEPPYFWDAFTKAFREGLLDIPASDSYSWLLLQLASLPGDWAPVPAQLAREPDILEKILTSSDGNIRNLGHKIKHALPLDPAQNSNNGDAPSGGRHDNDHADYKQTSIMPTTDEMLSKERSFYRTADFLRDSDCPLSRGKFTLTISSAYYEKTW